MAGNTGGSGIVRPEDKLKASIKRFTSAAPNIFSAKATSFSSSNAKKSKSTSSSKSGGGSSKVPTYSPPAYDEKKYRKGIDTTFYKNAIRDYNTQAEKQRATQLGEAKKIQENALKQAYIQRVQNQNALSDSLAMAGIRGGATETSNLRLMNQYGTAVGAANSDYSNSVNSINQAIDKNIFDYTSDMKSRAEEYTQNLAQARWQAARDDASAKYSAKRDDYWKKQSADREERWNKYNARNEFWNNYYLDKYSGYSKEALKKAEKTVKKKLKTAKTQAEKIRWQQALRGIGNRRGVIANSK